MALEQARILPFPGGQDTISRDAREFLPAALEIVETPASPLARAVSGVIVATAVFALGWSIIGKVDIIATAQGHLVPLGKTKTIQPLETSVVTGILVNDGDHVVAGQPLVTFDPTEAQADRDRYAKDLKLSRLDLARLEGELAALQSTTTAGLVDPPVDAQAWEIAQADDALQSTIAEERAKLASLDQQAREKQGEAQEASETIAQIQATLPIIQAEYDIRLKLKDMEFGNKIEWLEAEDQLVQQQRQIPVLERHRDEASAAASGLTQEYAATQAGYERDVLADLTKTRGDVSDLGAELAKAQRQLSLTTLTSPLDGTVQQLAIHTIGGVVTPAQALMVIVPDQGGLIVEADVENKDVGFVHVGQRADVKIAAFTFTRYGLIEGTVTGLSRDVAMDPQPAPNPNDTQDDPEHTANQPKEAGYVARIRLDRDWMNTETGRVALGPGMDVTAEIKTGRRRIIDYLLSPVAKYAMESGHER